jgi:hypothetical protein
MNDVFQASEKEGELSHYKHLSEVIAGQFWIFSLSALYVVAISQIERLEQWLLTNGND